MDNAKKTDLEPTLTGGAAAQPETGKKEPDMSSQDKSPTSHEEEEALHLMKNPPPSPGDEPWLEETLAHLKASSELSDLSQAELDSIHDAHHDVHTEDHQSEEDGVIEMSIRGKLTLKLNRNTDGQDVILRFGSTHLQISLSDGTEFKIPVKRKLGKK